MLRKMFAAKTTPLPPEAAVFRFAENIILTASVNA